MSLPFRKRILIQTPEGVAFSLYLAGPFTRFLAWIIDVLVIAAVSSAAFSIAGFSGALVGNVGFAFAIIFIFAFGFGYRIVMEWRFRGQTLGKRILRLRVMDAGGLRLQLHQIVLRNLIRVVDMLPFAYALGGTTMLFNARNQRLGDIAANSIVTYLPQDVPPDFARVLPGKYNSFRDYPHLEGRLRQQVSPEEADLLVRALLRRDTLDPAARVRVFRELTDHFREKVEFPDAAIAGITDEQYLRNTVDSVFRGKRG
ncbi:MAG: RDD family protein [Candidatus Hydrogenedentes bacterium]|nr:RDD family protein [Candidatus Hydrogenedentota bacterium]